MIEPFNMLFKHGEKGDKFYIIIKGLLSVEVPNRQISDWVAEKRYFQSLKTWKEGFDKKLENLRAEKNQ